LLNDLRQKLHIAINSTNEVILITIEEIEKYLHPEAQKALHSEIEKIISASPFRDQIQVFITTHSPFIISGVKNCKLPSKIYLIDKNTTVDLFSNKNTTPAKEGFDSQQALLMTHYILGSNLNDFFPEKLYLCENSISVLLQGISKKLGIPFNAYCLHTNGDGDTVNKSLNSIQLLEAIESTLKTKPFQFIFNTELVAIFDGPLNDAEQKKVSSVKAKFNNFNFTLLSNKGELEQEYPINWVNEYLLEKNYRIWDIKHYIKIKEHLLENGVPQKDIGKVKEDLAKYIVDKIDSKNSLEENLPLVYTILIPSGVTEKTRTGPNFMG
jgi:AAA ATPase domain